MRLLRLAVVALVALCLSGCQTPVKAGKPVTLTVSAASDLTKAFGEIGPLFEAKSGDSVVFNFGSTGQLSQQIAQGAPVDLFAAANAVYIDDLEAEGLVLSGTRRLFARGRLVLWTRSDSQLQLTGLEDLIKPEILHIAIANPDHAPYGVAAREALQTEGLWEELQGKLVLGEDARQALQYAQTGNVEVAIAPLSLSIGGDGRWILVPEELHEPLDQALAIVATTRHEAAARAFSEFVGSPEGRTIMRKYGFVLPGESTSP